MAPRRLPRRWDILPLSKRFTVLSRLLFIYLAALCVLLASLPAVAQGASQPQPSHPRITQPVDNRLRVTLSGNVHPLAQPRFDLGRVSDSFPAQRLFLLLQRSPERETALRQFLQDVHTRGNANYHKWLTPEAIGKLYGPDDSDITAVSAWLQSQGFSVARLTKGKTAIEFSGTAAQLHQAFNVEIHSYLVNGQTHYANDRDPQIPVALAPVVAGVTTMNDFAPKSYSRYFGNATFDRNTHKLVPQWTFPSGNNLLDFGPADFAVQYDVNPLYTSGITGSGVTIGILGDSNVDPSVVATYRSFFGLPANPLNVVVDGMDPGENYDAVESFLDVEVSGAVAPGATINLYTSAGTSLQYGLDLAAQRAVDDDIATVLSTSYGTCEQQMGTAGNEFWSALWEQAAAQGQTVFVSAGDGGPAGCDDFNLASPAQYGIAVNGIASTPWNVAVGGTDFYYSDYNAPSSTQQTQLNTYWDTVPTIFPTASLLQPVPEQPWNDPFGLNLYSGGVYNPNAPNIVAASGGPSSCATGVEGIDGTYSSCTAGHPKPAWQTGNGVPSDTVRDLPDVSLFSAAGENDSLYPICVNVGDCVVSDGNLTIGVVGGTSAASPAMAGIMALVNQKYGAQGQANFTLYPLAAQHSSAFHDITVGGNMVPCLGGTPDCLLSRASDNTKGFYALGFDATPGYDLATGLGSIDANLLVQYWNSLTFKPTNTTLSISPTTFTHGTPIAVHVGVTGSGGTPSGNVALVTTAAPRSNTGVGDLILQSGAASSTVNTLPGGQYQVTARYAGDSLFATSNSAPVTLNVAPEASTLSLVGSYYDYLTNSGGTLASGASYSYGDYMAMNATAKSASAPSGATDGIATGTVTFTDSSGSSSISSGPLSLGSANTAIWVPNQFAVGSHSVSATYSGDASFNPSSGSAPITFTVTKANPNAALSAASNPIGLGQGDLLTAVVGIYSNAAQPTGTVTFNAGTTVLGTASLSLNSAYGPYVSAATLNATTLPLGSNSVTATYGGDSNYSASTSNPVNVTVMQPAVLTASVTPTSGLLSQTYTVTATVAGANGQPAPTGSFGVLVEGGSSLSTSATLVNGTASVTFDGSSFFPGTVLVNAGYSGDSVYAPYNVTIPVTMSIPFSMTTTPVTISAPGATSGNTSTITLTPATGFTGPIYLKCTISYYPPGAQALPTCNIPSPVNVTGSAPVTATMTIASAASGSAALDLPSRPRYRFAAGATMLFTSILAFGIPTRRRRHLRLAGILFVFTVFLISAGCGGGSTPSGGGGTRNPIPGTTPGTYQFMVEGSFTSDFGFSAPQISMVQVTIQ
jgi:trimeric autotransporter adhesin